MHEVQNPIKSFSSNSLTEETKYLLFQGDIGGDVGEGEVGVAGVKGERIVNQGVMLVRARYFATYHRVVKCKNLFKLKEKRPNVEGTLQPVIASTSF